MSFFAKRGKAILNSNFTFNLEFELHKAIVKCVESYVAQCGCFALSVVVLCCVVFCCGLVWCGVVPCAVLRVILPYVLCLVPSGFVFTQDVQLM